MKRPPRIVLTPDELNRVPILGVTWSGFPTVVEANRFINRVEYATRRDPHPCKAFITNVEQGEVEVKVRNW